MNNSDGSDEKLEIISAIDVANYVVCPEAWRLKFIGKGKKKHTQRATESQQRKQEWAETQDFSATLRNYAKIIYLLLVAIVIVVFLLEYQRLFSLQ